MEAPTRVARLRALAELLDASIPVPGTRFRIGLDPIVGLIPGVGDAIGLGFSAWIVVQAARTGASWATLLRMLGNVGVDALVGAIPVAGDLFDFGWKANRRNIRLLERQLADPTATHRASRRVLGLAVAAVVAGFALLAALSVWGAVAAIRFLVHRT